MKKYQNPFLQLRGSRMVFGKEAWCANRKLSMDELQCPNFRVVVPAELDHNPGGRFRVGVVSTRIDTLESSELLRGGQGE